MANSPEAALVAAFEPIIVDIVNLEKRVDADARRSAERLGEVEQTVTAKVTELAESLGTKADATMVEKAVSGAVEPLASDISSLGEKVEKESRRLDEVEQAIIEKSERAEDAAVERASTIAAAKADLVESRVTTKLATFEEDITRLKRNDQHALLEGEAMSRITLIEKAIRDRVEEFLHTRTTPDLDGDVAEESPWLQS